MVALSGAGTCPSCGAGYQPGARFCPTCGHRLIERNDERRVATVVFADLARFTSLSETLDPEQLKNLMDRCFTRMAADVTRHGGRVDKVVGDAMVALFGAPVAHEDDAERAVRCALAMKASVADLAVQLGLGLALRVGINTGEVLVGAVHGGEYTAMGDVVNVASRLQAAADPGAVLVGPATHAATTAVVSYRPLGPVSVRNRDEPVEAWEALSTLAPPGRRPLRVSGPLVGRDDEVAILRHAFNLVAERQRPALAVVLGDAGMGKSRLLADLGRWAELTHGATVLEGRCAPYGQANPYWPLAEAVRQACGVVGADGAEAVATKLTDTLDRHQAGTEEERPGLVAALRYLLGDLAALADVDPQRAGLEGRRAARMLLAAMTRTRPALMVLSEMHWADDQVLEPLGRMLDRLAGSAVLLVLTARPELAERWSPPHGRHDHLTLHLGPLDPEAASALAERLLGSDPAAGSVAALVERSGGNPLFLEELAAYLSTGSAGELPVTLRGMVAARLDQLPLAERSLLEDAAVVGRAGTVASVAHLAATRGAPECESALEELHAQELLQVSGDAWEFRSDIVREVVYETLTKSERARRHWALATWLADADVDVAGAGVDERVAHHFACAAELAREVGAAAGVPADADRLAASALARAAAAAAGREAPLEAARLLDRALGLNPDRDTRWHLLLDRAEARARMRTLEAAREDVDTVLSEAGPELRARALTVLGTVQLHGGHPDEAAATLDEALTEWRARDDRRGEGQALRLAGMAAAESGDAGRADRLLSEALDIFRDVGDLRHEAWVMWHLAELAFAGGAVPLAEQRLAAADRLFLQAGDPGGSNWVQGLLGYVRLMQGRREEAAGIADRLLNSALDRGDPWATGMILVLQGATRLWLGRAADAIAPLTEARSTFASMEDAFGAWQAAGHLVRALAATGDGERARAAAAAAGLGLPPAPGTPPSPAFALAVSLGDGARVADLVADTDPRFSHEGKGSAGPEGGWGVSSETFIQAGLAQLQAGRIDDGLASLERALAMIGLSGEGAGITPSARAAEALARAAAGDTVGAREAAGLVLAGDPPPTYLDRCHALIARGLAAFREGDADRSASDLAAACRTAESTQDVLAAAVARLASSVAGGGETDAARAALERMGADPYGWETVFAAAVGQRV